MSKLSGGGQNLTVLDDLVEGLSTLSGVLGAVGSITGQSTTVGGHNGIEEVLHLPDAG
jgi:hypothetical protein